MLAYHILETESLSTEVRISTESSYDQFVWLDKIQLFKENNLESWWQPLNKQSEEPKEKKKEKE
jgi:hypothetical protein